MITPVQVTSILPAQAQTQKREPMPTPAAPPAAEAPASLAASIRSDGGLQFLQQHLQDKMAERFGPAEGEPAYQEAGAIVSPENTASRIVNFALGLREAHARQHPGQDAGATRADFEAEVRRGIAEGFSSARQYLEDLGQGDEETMSVIDQTWELVQAGLESAFQPPSDESSPDLLGQDDA
jgi:hypothetical protein|nr:DUF5610 domain-containing protein [Candidatus Krumholzibacteria bacterium]